MSDEKRTVTKYCEFCGEAYEAEDNKRGESQKYCCKLCRNRASSIRYVQRCKGIERVKSKTDCEKRCGFYPYRTARWGFENCVLACGGIPIKIEGD